MITQGNRTRVRRSRSSSPRAGRLTNQGTGRPAASRRPRGAQLVRRDGHGLGAMPRQAARRGRCVPPSRQAGRRRRARRPRACPRVQPARVPRARGSRSKRAGMASSPHGSSRWSQRSETSRRSRRRGARPRRTRGPDSRRWSCTAGRWASTRELPALRAAPLNSTRARRARAPWHGPGHHRARTPPGRLPPPLRPGGAGRRAIPTVDTRRPGPASHVIEASLESIDLGIGVRPGVRECLGIEGRRHALHRWIRRAAASPRAAAVAARVAPARRRPRGRGPGSRPGTRGSRSAVVHGVNATNVGTSARPRARHASTARRASSAEWPLRRCARMASSNASMAEVTKAQRVPASRSSSPGWASRCSTLIVTS